MTEAGHWELRPGEARESDAHIPGTREIVYVEKGTLMLSVGGRTDLLQEGAAAVFVGDRPHAYANTSSRDIRLVLAVADL